MKTALSRLGQALIHRGMGAAEFAPALQGEGYVQRQRNSENLGAPGGGEVNNWYVAGVSATWELDLFAGLQRATESAQARAVEAAQHIEALARERYNAGLVVFYHLLDARSTLLQLDDQLIQSKGDVTACLTRIYTALGGGWQAIEP